MPTLVKCRKILKYLEAQKLGVPVDDSGLVEALGELHISMGYASYCLLTNYLGFEGDPKDLMANPIMQTLLKNKLIKKNHVGQIVEINYEVGWAENVNPLANIYHLVSSPRHESLLLNY